MNETSSGAHLTDPAGVASAWEEMKIPGVGRWTSRWNGSDRLIRLGFLRSLIKYKAMGLGCGWDVQIYAQARIYQPALVRLGSRVSLGDYSVVWGGGGVEIGRDSMISTNCAIVSLTHDVDALHAGKLYRETLVGRPVKLGANVWIGANTVIMPGVSIGENSIVGAGSVVTADVAANCVVAGAPARLLRRLDG